jgi:protocatechuate 3,4-dioxygenase beta subunit
MKPAACLLVWAVFLCGQKRGAESAAADTSSACFVSGRVVNAANGEPVRRARLMLRRADNPANGSDVPSAYTTLADDQGRFAMKGMAAGKYRFAATHASFVEAAYGARRPGREGVTLSLDAGQQVTGVVFRMTPQAVITGRILDADGDPMQDARVSALRYEYITGKRQLVPSGGDSTNDLGEYRVSGLAPGRYFLKATYGASNRPTLVRTTRSASKPIDESFVPTYYPGTMDIGNAGVIELAAGSLLRGLDFTLTKTRAVTVRGHMTAPEGVKPQMTMIMLAPRGEYFGEMIRRARVFDQQGTFEFNGVSPGSYSLSAQIQDGKVSYSAHQQVEVGTANLEDVNLTPSAGSQLSGQLRFEGQTPPNPTGIGVSLEDNGESEIRWGATPDGEVTEDGSFTLSNIESQTYKVRVRGLPDGYYLKSVRVGDDELKETGLDGAREHRGALLVTVSSRAGQIEGIVMNSKDQPVPGASVVLVPEPKKREHFEAFDQVTTDQYGRYTLKSIEPGEYQLFAWEDLEPGEYMDPEFLKPVEGRGAPVSIHEGSRENVDLKLIAATPPAAPAK